MDKEHCANDLWTGAVSLLVGEYNTFEAFKYQHGIYGLTRWMEDLYQGSDTDAFFAIVDWNDDGTKEILVGDMGMSTTSAYFSYALLEASSNGTRLLGSVKGTQTLDGMTYEFSPNLMAPLRKWLMARAREASAGGENCTRDRDGTLHCQNLGTDSGKTAREKWVAANGVDFVFGAIQPQEDSDPDEPQESCTLSHGTWRWYRSGDEIFRQNTVSRITELVYVAPVYKYFDGIVLTNQRLWLSLSQGRGLFAIDLDHLVVEEMPVRGWSSERLAAIEGYEISGGAVYDLNLSFEGGELLYNGENLEVAPEDLQPTTHEFRGAKACL